MSNLQTHTDYDQVTVASIGYGQQLLEQSAAARARGDHWRAQQLASAAHKWAREEVVRLRYLGQAQEEWTRMTREIKQAWDREVTCATLDELTARNPKLKRAIASREAAAVRIRALGGTLPQAATTHDGAEPPTSR